MLRNWQKQQSVVSALHDAANGAESIHYMRPLAVQKPLRTRATIVEGCLSSTSGGVLPILSVSVQPDGY
jgi:hypothetical protein